MGGLRTGLGIALPGLVLLATDPAPASVRVKVGRKATVLVRLVFRKGVQVEARNLPRTWVDSKPEGPWVAYDDLSPEGRKAVLQALWPEDRWQRQAILHKVRWPELESVWLFASLFTGHGQNYDRLKEANPRLPEKLRQGDTWRIPRTILSKTLGGPVSGVLKAQQPEEELEDEARIAAYRALLSFEELKGTRYARYRLRKGEALYSSVVMRFTDRVDPKEVNALAQVVAKASDIADVRSIAPGTLIRIPVEDLAAPFQPEGATALAEDREVREEVRRTTRQDAGPRLKGVRIVLDAGHGGIDIGAKANGVWESDYVYDIAMRTRRLLEESSEAQVASTIRFPTVGFRSRDRITAPTREAQLLTTPPFDNDGESPSAVSVHLRWVLANDLLSTRSGGDFKKTLFISLHADSLHPSSQGTMVYVPGAALAPSSFSLPESRGAQVQEWKRSRQVTFSAKEKVQGEARSRLFAETMLRALRAEEIPIHENRPIRNVIHRGGRSFLPAVIRYSTAATKVLVEVVNLQNEEDAANLKDPDFRERYAQALVQSIRAYFGR